jgi:hypothetical protein
MENDREELYHQNDDVSQFPASKSTKKILEALKKHLTLDKQEEWESDPTWNNVSVAESCCPIRENKTQIKSEIGQHHVKESGFNFVQMDLLNHSSGEIHQLGNLSNIFPALPQNAMMDLEQAY